LRPAPREFERKARMEAPGGECYLTIAMTQIASVTEAVTMRETVQQPQPIDAGAAWTAVAERDARQDGRFVYAVRTTGVFCRPSCPARRPLRLNVEFFATPGEAAQAGYRPCARCRGGAAPAGEGAVERAVKFIEAHLDARVTLAALARHVGVSPFHLQRTFTRVVGASPRAFQEARRLARFKARVRRGADVGAATYEAGYGSSRALYESARARLGMTPAVYRRGAAGERIRYATAAWEHGLVLVAATERGVCAVQLGDDGAALERSLAAEFPRASLERDDEGMRRWVEGVLRSAGGDASASLDLDLRGTAFQLRVWRALRKIPYGETRSYGAVAKAIGQPSATRAVARACATNRIALVVPCHRVVREGSEAGGYRWGAERKRRLLDLERR
jgi:AraC family transcriptional regulator of adaptative response/methylated-DNA-[protein]-cysteine methyltransferase